MIAAVLAVLAAAPVAVRTDDPVYLDQIGRAIEHGRLIQAHEMMGMRGRSPELLRSPAYLRILGQLALAEDNNGDAFLHYRMARDADPTDCLAWEGMGLAALRLGRNNAALTALEEATRLCTDRWQSFNALGVLADRSGNWAAGKDAYAKALGIAPDQPAVLNNVGFSYLLQRRFDEAEAVLSKAKMIAPRDERIANNLDLAVAGQGKSITAASDTQAYRLNNAGYMAYLGGNIDAARTYFTEAMKLSPSYFTRASANLEMIEHNPKP